MAIAKATGNYIVFMDGDCIPRSSFIADHMEIANKACFVQARRAFVEGSVVSDYLKGKKSLRMLWLSGKISGRIKTIRWPKPIIKSNCELHGILGCNLGIWKQDLIDVNGYDEAFEGWGAEDSDLAARLFHLGKKRRFVYGRAILFHLNHQQLSRDNYDYNKKLLSQTIASKTIRCDKGLVQYL